MEQKCDADKMTGITVTEFEDSTHNDTDDGDTEMEEGSEDSRAEGGDKNEDDNSGRPGFTKVAIVVSVGLIPQSTVHSHESADLPLFKYMFCQFTI